MPNIFGTRSSFKPFQYPWAYDLWLKHEQMHWLPSEVPLHEDVRDWNNKLDEVDRNFLTDVFLLFTQSDIDVANGYIQDYLPHFKHPELRMMLLGFAAREATHIAAYSHLIETLGKPDSFYSQFSRVPVMRDKHEFFDKVVHRAKKKESLPVQIAGISAFTEGMFLFSSFVMLLAYQRAGLMKGMGQIVSWSVLDEQMHVNGLTRVFRAIIEENPSWWNDANKREIYSTAELMTEMETDFIHYVYAGAYKRKDLTSTDLCTYIRYIVDMRLKDMGLKAIYNIKENPLPWVDEIIGSQNHENFFETRATSYAKGALQGSWGDVWGGTK